MEDKGRKLFQSLLVGKHLVHGLAYMEHQGKLPAQGQFQMDGEQLILEGFSIPKGRIVQVKPGFPNGVDPTFCGQGFHEAEERRKGWNCPTTLPCGYCGKLGVEGKTQEYPGGLILLGMAGKFLMAGKILHVPGAGCAGKPQTPSLLFCLGKVFQEIPQVTVGIRSHRSSLCISLKLPQILM
jgi:hypothetical protein